MPPSTLAPTLGAATRRIAHLLVTPCALPTAVSFVGSAPLPVGEIAGFPPLFTPDLGEKARWLNEGGPTLLQLRLTFDRPVPVNTLALLGTNAGADDTVRFVGTEDPGFNIGPGIDYVESAPADTPDPHWPQPELGDWDETLAFRWLEETRVFQNWLVEVVFHGAYYDVGRLVIGYGYQPTIDAQDGHAPSWDDPSIERTTVGSKIYHDRRPKRRRYTCPLKIADEHEAYGDIFRLERQHGITEPVLVSIDPHPENPFLHDQTFYAHFRELSPMPNSHVAIWDKQLTFEELR